ncbi:MAG: sensor histidine kinase [Acidobacteriota bacterium]
MPDLPNHEAEHAQIHRLSVHSLAARTRAVWVGFGLLLLLILFSSANSYFSVRSLQRTNATTRADSRQRDELLDQLANDVLSASRIARDHLLESDESRITQDRMELETVRMRMFDTLASYESKVPGSEIQSLNAFRANIEEFWTSVDPPLHWSAVQRERDSDAYLAEVLLPKGQEVERLARDIALRDERELDSLSRGLEDQYLGLQRQMFLSSALVLLGGLIAAGLSVRRIRRLEFEAESRYEQVEEARLLLRDLSSQLVNAQEEERRKLSRELHDQLGQTMSALVTELARLEREAEASNTKERLTYARQMAEDTVRSIRDTALLLRPSMLDDLGLEPALRWQAREVRRRSGLKVRMMADDIADDLADSYKTCIFRVVQEALYNCVKHASATEARVVVRQLPEGLSVSVQDDGVGFDTTRERGMGMVGMTERVTRLGGIFKVESKPGQGTVLSALFPGVGHVASGQGLVEKIEEPSQVHQQDKSIGKMEKPA